MGEEVMVSYLEVHGMGEDVVVYACPGGIGQDHGQECSDKEQYTGVGLHDGKPVQRLEDNSIWTHINSLYFVRQRYGEGSHVVSLVVVQK
jgi:hypothetical protein